MYSRSGKPSRATIETVKHLLTQGEYSDAERLLCGGIYGVGYDAEIFELYGKCLLGLGKMENSGRFLFLSGSRNREYGQAIDLYIKNNHDASNYLQLLSSFPMKLRSCWNIMKYPELVYHELKELGFPDSASAEK